MRRIYFAHPIIDYDTLREKEALFTINCFFSDGAACEIVNPNQSVHQAGYDDRGEFAYWTDLATSCDDVCFMAMPGEKRLIGSGVHAEVEACILAGRGIYEISRTRIEGLPQIEFYGKPVLNDRLRQIADRAMDIADTRLVTRMIFDYVEGR